MEFDLFMPYHPDAEEALERATVNLFKSLGYAVLNAYDEIKGTNITGRETLDEVVLLPRLKAALRRLNPDLPEQALNTAIEQITSDRDLMTTENANQQVSKLIRDGVKVTYKDDEGSEATDTVRVVDWDNPDA